MKCPIIVTALLLSAVVSIAQTNTGADSTAAKKMVSNAAAFLKSKGVEAGLKELSNPQGQFVKGELYVFAYTLEGVMAAHPKNAKLIGKNLLEVPDVEGILFRKEILEKATKTGSGWVDYKYKNPESGQIESKTTYLLKSGDHILCCGIYK